MAPASAAQPEEEDDDDDDEEEEEDEEDDEDEVGRERRRLTGARGGAFCRASNLKGLIIDVAALAEQKRCTAPAATHFAGFWIVCISRRRV